MSPRAAKKESAQLEWSRPMRKNHAVCGDDSAYCIHSHASNLCSMIPSYMCKVEGLIANHYMEILPANIRPAPRLRLVAREIRLYYHAELVWMVNTQLTIDDT